MALARLALKNVHQRVFSSAPTLPKRGEELVKRFASTAEKSAEVAVSEGSKKPRLFPRRRGRRGLSLWRNRDDPSFVPALNELFPSGLGNALLQATENINKLFENTSLTPSRLMGRVKEQDDCYKLRYEVPGMSKEDLKITVDDGVLTIKGEHKEEEEEEGSDDEYWSARSYGYYNTSLVLPDDAVPDDIKAELKDGVLHIVIPRNEKVKKDAKEIKIK